MSANSVLPPFDGTDRACRSEYLAGTTLNELSECQSRLPSEKSRVRLSRAKTWLFTSRFDTSAKVVGSRYCSRRPVPIACSISPRLRVKASCCSSVSGWAWETSTAYWEMLAWLGADVIKVEEPGRGDVARYSQKDRADADALFFLAFNANKRSLTLNLKHAGGQEVFRSLLKTADVLLENFGPGVIERLGFGYPAVREINPRLVYASIKGFGSYGPYRDYKSYEPIAQAMGGAMSVTCFPDGPPPSTRPSSSASGTGIACASGIRPPLMHRHRTPPAHHLQASIHD